VPCAAARYWIPLGLMSSVTVPPYSHHHNSRPIARRLPRHSDSKPLHLLKGRQRCKLLIGRRVPLVGSLLAGNIRGAISLLSTGSCPDGDLSFEIRTQHCQHLVGVASGIGDPKFLVVTGLSLACSPRIALGSAVRSVSSSTLNGPPLFNENPYQQLHEASFGLLACHLQSL
jgi:hypothetical protein